MRIVVRLEVASEKRNRTLTCRALSTRSHGRFPGVLRMDRNQWFHDLPTVSAVSDDHSKRRSRADRSPNGGGSGTCYRSARTRPARWSTGNDRLTRSERALRWASKRMDSDPSVGAPMRRQSWRKNEGAKNIGPDFVRAHRSIAAQLWLGNVGARRPRRCCFVRSVQSVEQQPTASAIPSPQRARSTAVGS